MLIWPVDNFLKTASIFYSLESYSAIQLELLGPGI